MDKQQATQTLHGLIEVGGPWLRTLPVRVFKELLEAGAEIEEENERGETMLYAAIFHHAPDKMLKFLLKAGAATEREVRLDSPDYIGSSIMYALNAQGNSKVTYTHVRVLIEEGGANPNYVDWFGETPFMLAARRGSIEICDLLVHYGADPKQMDRMGDDALRHAVRGMIKRNLLYLPNGGLVDYLQGQGLDINRRSSEDGTTALMEAAVHPLAYNIVELLLEKGAKINVQDASGKTALMYAAEENDSPGFVCDLLRAGADPDITDRDGHTALWYAATKNMNPNVALQLLGELKK